MVNQQCPCSKEGQQHPELHWQKAGKGEHSPHLSTGETHLENWVQFWAPPDKNYVDVLENIYKKPWRWLRDWNIWHRRRSWKNWRCSALGRGLGNNFSMYQCLTLGSKDPPLGFLNTSPWFAPEKRLLSPSSDCVAVVHNSERNTWGHVEALWRHWHSYCVWCRLSRIMLQTFFQTQDIWKHKWIHEAHLGIVFEITQVS